MSLVVIIQRQHPDARPLSDYRVTVKVTRSPTDLVTIAEHDVVSHPREAGWPALIAKLLRDYYPEVMR